MMDGKLGLTIYTLRQQKMKKQKLDVNDLSLKTQNNRYNKQSAQKIKRHINIV